MIAVQTMEKYKSPCLEIKASVKTRARALCSAGAAALKRTQLLYCFSWDRTPESHQEEMVPRECCSISEGKEEAECSETSMLLKTSKGRGTIQIKADWHSHHKQVLHVALNWAVQCRGENATTEFGTVDKTELGWWSVVSLMNLPWLGLYYS